MGVQPALLRFGEDIPLRKVRFGDDVPSRKNRDAIPPRKEASGMISGGADYGEQKPSA